jgi:ribosomal protein L7/L12
MGWFGGGDGSRDDYLRLETRLARLEEQVARLTAMLQAAADPTTPAVRSVPPASAVPEWEVEARTLKAQGKAIHAIKAVREATGWGLKEAKQYVDRL